MFTKQFQAAKSLRPRAVCNTHILTESGRSLSKPLAHTHIGLVTTITGSVIILKCWPQGLATIVKSYIEGVYILLSLSHVISC